MPRYELALILKIMQRPETAAALKRTMETLMKHGAVVRNLENLGEKSLPYKISKHSERHSRGGYFLVDLEAPPTLVTIMLDHLARDIDVIRPTFLRQKLSKPLKECAGMVQPDYEAKLRSRRK
ncbi:28S ribosomal protein S6, mitochondrial isoform X2 [Rhinatrema bivittatum]|uniref:28S ribosomal protein S6, mitochondrial isoform X2 n=1 Tax=Rhinatrema bivittatum TaxID=194408 RepID=UPI001127C812|nr:28S ribosomal protein S6, mitochondrial isoform X2 [Rhinatrema bivittatum]